MAFAAIKQVYTSVIQDRVHAFHLVDPVHVSPAAAHHAAAIRAGFRRFRGLITAHGTDVFVLSEQVRVPRPVCFLLHGLPTFYVVLYAASLLSLPSPPKVSSASVPGSPRTAS